VVLNQQATLEERRLQARESATRLGLTMPLFLDGMENDASRAFAAWPERLVLVDVQARIAYPGKPGPWGFSPEEAEHHLAALLEGSAPPE
jgi:Iodothyronine deiodinase